LSYFSLARSRPSAHSRFPTVAPPSPSRRRLRRRAAPPAAVTPPPVAPPRVAPSPAQPLPHTLRAAAVTCRPRTRTQPRTLAPVCHRAVAATTAPPKLHLAIASAFLTVACTSCISTVPLPTCIAPHSRVHASHATCSAFCPNHRASPRSPLRFLDSVVCRDGS
jgi:hypothetical protein